MSMTLLTNSTFRNIDNQTDTFEASQPPILEQHGLKVPPRFVNKHDQNVALTHRELKFTANK